MRNATSWKGIIITRCYGWENIGKLTSAELKPPAQTYHIKNARTE